MKADYLIVGGGIAGSILALTLHRAGKQVAIVGSPGRPSASLAAAGIFNPLTGKKLVRTWKADELFPSLTTFYGEAEQLLGGSFIHFTPIYRPFRSIEEQNSYLAQTAEPTVGRYVSETVDHRPYTPWIHNPYGGLEVTGSGWIDVAAFLAAVKLFFAKKSRYFETDFAYNSLLITENGAEWQGDRYHRVIFCEGPQGRDNPWFDWLPFNPVKGQTLEVEIAGYPVRSIINQGIFILPLGEGRCRVGATYTWHDLDWQTTEDGRVYLEDKLRQLLKAPYRIVGQRAGIRPATKDRRPLIGLHPEYPALGIFNGLGTKGVSLAPYFADQFVDFLDGRKELDAEVNIQRSFSLYYRVNKRS